LTLRFASLGSGSRGNALLVEADDTLVMIDCGLPRRTLEERLAILGRSPRDIAAILVTHEHGDHARGLAAFATRYAIPAWLTPGTGSAIPGLTHRRALNCHRGWSVGALEIEPFPVPHDAREPCQFVFAAQGRRLAVLTDTGHVTPTILERLEGCDALALECNHDLDQLMRGRYPESVKARVASRYGHLNNAQSAALLEHVAHPGLQWVVGLHLSEQNNSPAAVERTLAPLGAGERWAFKLATQDAPLDWVEIE
jgi:phosphoribosyl 1,2-cyclic phosphodiesterase